MFPVGLVVVDSVYLSIRDHESPYRDPMRNGMKVGSTMGRGHKETTGATARHVSGGGANTSAIIRNPYVKPPSCPSFDLPIAQGQRPGTTSSSLGRNVKVGNLSVLLDDVK